MCALLSIRYDHRWAFDKSHLDRCTLAFIDLSLATDLNFFFFFFVQPPIMISDSARTLPSCALKHGSITTDLISFVRDWVSHRRSQHIVRLITSCTQDRKSQIKEEEHQIYVVQSSNLNLHPWGIINVKSTMERRIIIRAQENQVFLLPHPLILLLHIVSKSHLSSILWKII